MNFYKTPFDLKIDFLIEKSISGLKNRKKHEQTGKNSKIGRKRKFTEDS